MNDQIYSKLEQASNKGHDSTQTTQRPQRHAGIEETQQTCVPQHDSNEHRKAI